MKNKHNLINAFIILIVLFSLFSPIYQATSSFNFNRLASLFSNLNDNPLNIQSITPKDDAFHGSTSFPSVEWWYFDSMLNYNYSVHLGFKVFTFHGINLLKPTLNIYHQQQIIVNETILLPPGSFSVSESYPKITIRNQAVMLFNNSGYNETGEWEYIITYPFSNVGVDLKFSSETKGWQYETAHEGWTVAIPQGKVEGNLFIKDEKLKVNGRGYHDHNWNFSLKTPARGWSWFWGKITGDTLNLAWAEIKETGLLKQTFTEKLGVVNTKKDKFIVIDPQNISFSAESYIFRDNRLIPTIFTINIDQQDVFIDVTLKANIIHRSDPSVVTLHYWRYFVSVNGVISYKDTNEHIENKTQIMEYMRFI